MSSPYIQQFEQKIRLLIAEKKYKDAINICNQLLKDFPQERELLELKADIEEIIQSEREGYIKEKLKEAEDLLDEDKFYETLKVLKPLLDANIQNDSVKKIYKKAQEGYKSEINEKQKQFQQEKEKKYMELLSTNPDGLLAELNVLESNNYNNKDILKFSYKFKELIIAKKIKTMSELIFSDKFDAIERFIDELKKIDSSNPKVKDLEKVIKQRKLGNQIENKKEFLYQGMDYIETLMKLKKFQKVIQVCSELLDVDKNNKILLQIREKASQKLKAENVSQIAKTIQSEYPKALLDFNNNKAGFVKL